MAEKFVLDNKTRIFWTSDTHYHHRQLIPSLTSFPDGQGARPFDSLEEHDNALVAAINSQVGPRDILFHLGDWSFGSYGGDHIQKIKEFRARLDCEQIHLILGNHDQEIRDDLSDVRSLFQSVDWYKEIYVIQPSTERGVKARKQHVVMSHYPIQSWNGLRRGSWMLHGHCHGSLPAELAPNGKLTKRLDVGSDPWAMSPLSFEQIDQIMDSRSIWSKDHH